VTNPAIQDLYPVLNDRAIGENFRRIIEANRRMRRIVHILLDALSRGGFAIPADLVDEFNQAFDGTN